MKTKLIALLFALLPAVASAAVLETNVPPSVKALAGSEWVLKDLCGTPVPANSKATLTIGTDGTLSGNAGVNRFNGRARGSDGKIQAGPFISTRMAGPPEAMKVEANYLKALGSATKFDADVDTLRVTCAGYDKPLTFTRKAKP